MRTGRSGGTVDVAYPVARMRSMISRILRRLSLCLGSDNPTPRGPGGVIGSPIDDTSGVVAKELIDEMEDVLLLWGSEDIGPQRIQPGSFYRYADEHRAQKGSVAGYTTYGVFDTSPAHEFSVCVQTQ